MEKEAIAVIDMEMSNIYIYNVPKEWGTEETEKFIGDKGHELSTSTWGAFTGYVLDRRIPSVEYDVMSPDDISINPLGYYKSPEEAGRALEEWMKQFEEQGYYASNHGRIPIEQLALHCNLKRIE